MKKSVCILLSIVMMLLAPTVAFAKDVHDGAKGLYTMGDVDFSESITAADARLILRQSVNLENFTGVRILFADVNFDGAITAADARLALRASVKLETLQKHALTVIEEEKATCIQEGYIQGGCTCCQVICRIDIPGSRQHNLLNGKCSACGYFDKNAAHKFMVDYVCQNGMYYAPVYQIWENTPGTTFGLGYDLGISTLYLNYNFDAFVTVDNVLCLYEYEYYLCFNPDLDEYTLICYVDISYDNEIFYLTMEYDISEEQLDIDSTGALRETFFEAPEEVGYVSPEQKEEFREVNEMIAIEMMLRFDMLAEKYNFGFSSYDLGFVNL